MVVAPIMLLVTKSLEFTKARESCDKDILYFFPFRYVDRSKFYKISEIMFNVEENENLNEKYRRSRKSCWKDSITKT